MSSRLALLADVLAKSANSAFDDVEIRGAALYAISGLARTEFAVVQKLNVNRMIQGVLKTVDKVKIGVFAFLDAVIEFKRADVLDE